MVRKDYQEGDSDLRTQGKEGCQDIRHLTSTASVTQEKSEAAWYRGVSHGWESGKGLSLWL